MFHDCDALRTDTCKTLGWKAFQRYCKLPIALVLSQDIDPRVVYFREMKF